MATLAIILNWNEIDLTMRSIASLKAQKKRTCDILVVDNHSLRNPKKDLKQKYPDVYFIRNKENLGVAGGRNVGLKYAIEKKYAYILLFDNDAHAHSHMLYHLLRCMDKNEMFGIVGPKIYQDGRSNIIWRAGCTSWKLTYLHSIPAILKKICRYLKRPLPPSLDTIRGEDHIDVGQYDQEIDTQFQIGCAQLIRLETLARVGLLDNDYSPYGSEDIDFCERVLKDGWRIRYVPKAFCWHRIKSSVKNHHQRVYFNTRNLIILARKNLSPAYFWFVFMPDYLFVTLPIMMLENLLKSQISTCKAIWRALLWNINSVKERGIYFNK